MPSNRRKNNKKAKAVRDPSAYATISVPSARHTEASTSAPEIVDPPAPPPIEEEPVDDPAPQPNFTLLGLAQRQAASRLSLELSLKARLAEASPTIQLSGTSENKLIERMRNGHLPIPTAPLSVVGEKEWARAANFVYETLLQYGFRAEDIEGAMMAARGSGDIMQALTWLCVHVPTERMPVDMRDKHEYSTKRPSKEEKEEEVRPAATHLPRIDQVAVSTDDLVVSLCDLGLDDDDDGDGYSSDEDPSACHARHVLQLRGYEEWTEYLQANNAGNRYNPRIVELRRRIARVKRVLSDLESDLLFKESVSLDMCQRMWPEYHDALLDDIRRFRTHEPDTTAEVAVVKKPMARAKEEAPADISDSDDDSVIGFGAALDHEESWSSETVVYKGPRVVDTSIVPHGWSGAPPRDLLLDTIRRRDRHATAKYHATPCAYGFTCTLTITWSQPNKLLRECRAIPHTQSPVQVLGPVTQSWTVPHELIVGSTARDARDLSVLVYLYSQEPHGERLAPPLADVWALWDAQRREAEALDIEKRVGERARFLSKLRAAYEASLPSATPAVEEEEEVVVALVPQPVARESSRLRAKLWGAQTIGARRQGTTWKQKFGSAQARLPARQHRQEIMEALANNQVCVIRGETGSGKSSQIPQYALEHLLSNAYGGSRVLCTQPRRISAMTIAARVSQELGDQSLGISGSLVGYQIRFNARSSDSNALLFCTTGVLLRMAAGDPSLRGISTIICDEVQERTLELDFLLILLQRLLPKRPDLKLILMSATIDTTAFSCYFDSCPVVDIPGRAFPVTSVYLPRLVHLSGYVMEDNSRFSTRAGSGSMGYAAFRHWDLGDPLYVSPAALATVSRMRTDVVNIELIHHLLRGLNPAPTDTNPWIRYCQSNVPIHGSVLVFLPGLSEIRRLLGLLNSDTLVHSWATVVPLHSSFANETASGTITYTDLAFAPVADGRRKIVLSTNVAETGITIPDVTVVIDCGMSNQALWDKRRRLTTLRTLPISKANVRQRAGRAGRLQPGIALCLFTEEQWSTMPEYEVPEMHRMPLASLCLQTKAHGIRDSMKFLMMSLDPPPQSAVAHAIAQLQDAGALDEDEQLTPIGKHLCNLPVDLHVGKLLIAGALLGCLDPALTLAATMSTNSSIVMSGSDALAGYRRNPEQYLPYVTPSEATSSDFLGTLAAYEHWRQNVHRSRSELRDFCQQSSLNRDALDAVEDCREQYLRLLYDQGLLHLDLPASMSLTRAIRPPIRGSALRQGLVVVPTGANKNGRSLGVLYAALSMSFDHLLMPTPTGYSIGQSHVTKRVEGIGHAILIVDRERMSTRPIDIDRSSVVPHGGPLLSARLSSVGQGTIAHDVTGVGFMHVVFFARSLVYWPKAKQMSVNGWVDARCYARSAVVLLVMRERLEEILEFRVTNPMKPLPAGLERWRDAILDVLKSQ
ncbi:hypothetical protein IWW37_002374 [Coemansia sp. RSA 2050]|nr:hypothetical protein IWW37_002374 [Coemansia sp. RSA 2050]